MSGRSLTRTSFTVSSEEEVEEEEDAEDDNEEDEKEEKEKWELSEVGVWKSLFAEEEEVVAPLFFDLSSLSRSLRAESASDLRIERRARAQATDWRMSRGASGAPESPVAEAAAESAEKE